MKKMKIIFSPKFFEQYDSDPAAEAGRLEPTVELLKKDPFYEFIEPEPASEEDILRAHTQSHYNQIKRSAQYQMAMLAAGGAIKAAEYGVNGIPAFGLIRPPGHHASANSCWGFCFFNNMAISLLKLISEKKISSAFILDFDLHTGDGNINILGDIEGITIFNPSATNEEEYIDSISEKLEALADNKPDIICASAGFDNAICDWGHLLSENAYARIGAILKNYANRYCEGKRFAILEGGYNFDVMAKNIDQFCRNFG